MSTQLDPNLPAPVVGDRLTYSDRDDCCDDQHCDGAGGCVNGFDRCYYHDLQRWAELKAAKKEARDASFAE